MSNNLENYLSKFNEQDWLAAIEKLLPAIHEVDRNATEIWFRFFPLEFFRYLETAEDRDKTIYKLALQGDYWSRLIAWAIFRARSRALLATGPLKRSSRFSSNNSSQRLKCSAAKGLAACAC